MKKIILNLAIVILILLYGLLGFISFSSAESNIITYTNEFDIVAGSSICFHEQLENNKDEEINVTKINHSGIPDLEGINIILFNATSTNNGYKKGEELKLPLIIDAGETYHFFICYYTDVALKPDTYQIETNFYITEEETTTTSSSKQNKAPVADADGPYFELKGIPIDFNASKSYDSDGEIKSYGWNFGDGNTSNKMTVSHAYDEGGNYTVTLVVTDNKGKTDTDTTYAIIRGAGNIPPSIPEIDGKTILKTNKNYSFTAYSYNNDNDSLKYNFTWDDKTYNTTDFVENGTTVEKNHSWNTKGIYDIKVTVTDENNATSSNTLTVYVDVIEFIKNDIEGYLLDENADGIYDLFHNNKTGNKTYLEFIDIGYKIDTDDDGDWDYKYNTTTKTIQEIKEDTKKETNVLYYILGPIIVALIFIAIIILFFKKSE